MTNDKTMTELIITIQNYLARAGAPEWLLKPSAWLLIACGLAGVAIVVRMLFKRNRDFQPASPAAEQRVRESSGGIFGAWTEAFASQIPESDNERREFGAM